MGGTDFLTQTFELAHVYNMGAGDTAQALCQHYIGSSMNHAIGLKSAMVSWHDAGNKIIPDLSDLNTQMINNRVIVHLSIAKFYLWSAVPNAGHSLSFLIVS
jgi:hypothetical protein